MLQSSLSHFFLNLRTLLFVICCLSHIFVHLAYHSDVIVEAVYHKLIVIIFSSHLLVLVFYPLQSSQFDHDRFFQNFLGFHIVSESIESLHLQKVLLDVLTQCHFFNLLVLCS